MKHGRRVILILFSVIILIALFEITGLHLHVKKQVHSRSLNVDYGLERRHREFGNATQLSSFGEEFVTTKSNIDDFPCEDECQWLQEQQRRRNTVYNACAYYKPENINRDVLKHILVSDSHKLLYCYIPKVACTNWKRIILLLNGKHVKNVHYTLIPSLSDYTTKEVNMRIRDYTKVIIVRNPHERLLSAYMEKMNTSSPDALLFQKIYGPIIKKFHVKYLQKNFDLGSSGKVRLNTSLEKDTTKLQFQEFIRYVSDTDNAFNNGPGEEHWREMYRLCNPCSIQYDFIGKIETLPEDSQFILSHIGAKNLMSIVLAKPQHATNSSGENRVQKAFEQVTEEDVLQFEKRFEKDLMLFGYQRPTTITRFKSIIEDRKDGIRQLSNDNL